MKVGYVLDSKMTNLMYRKMSRFYIKSALLNPVLKLKNYFHIGQRSVRPEISTVANVSTYWTIANSNSLALHRASFDAENSSRSVTNWSGFVHYNTNAGTGSVHYVSCRQQQARFLVKPKSYSMGMTSVDIRYFSTTHSLHMAHISQIREIFKLLKKDEIRLLPSFPLRELARYRSLRSPEFRLIVLYKIYLLKKSDEQFTKSSYEAGLFHVIQNVSRMLGNGDLDGLKDVMLPESFDQLKSNYHKLPFDSKQELINIGNNKGKRVSSSFPIFKVTVKDKKEGDFSVSIDSTVTYTIDDERCRLTTYITLTRQYKNNIPISQWLVEGFAYIVLFAPDYMSDEDDKAPLVF